MFPVVVLPVALPIIGSFLSIVVIFRDRVTVFPNESFASAYTYPFWLTVTLVVGAVAFSAFAFAVLAFSPNAAFLVDDVVVFG